MHRARFLKNIQPRRCMVENRNLYVVEWIDSAKGTVNVVFEMVFQLVIYVNGG